MKELLREKLYKKIFIIFFLFIPINQYSKTLIANLPSGWYPQEKRKLEDRITYLKKEAQNRYGKNCADVQALIVPHAGYSYSGTIAASAFNCLNPNTLYDQIIILAPAHNIPFQGIAVPADITQYNIATGTLIFNKKTLTKLTHHHLFLNAEKLPKNPFKDEHSFEIQCPFIKYYCNSKIPLIPLLIGYLTDKEIRQCADILKKYITPQTLIIISSDFIHYGQKFDYVPFGTSLEKVLPKIQSLDFEIINQLFKPSLLNFLTILKQTKATICGKYPLALFLALIENKSLEKLYPNLIAYSTSYSENTGNKDVSSCVSYAAISYSRNIFLTEYEKNLLLKYAHNVVYNTLNPENKKHLEIPPLNHLMEEKYGLFVTWTNSDKTLRGCMGTTEPINNIIDSINYYAKIAAFKDPRFNPITKDEILIIKPSITLITPFKSIRSYKDIDLENHGIMLEYDSKKALFLPKVAIEQGWNLTKTLEELCIKANLPKNTWQNKKTLFKVCETVEHF